MNTKRRLSPIIIVLVLAMMLSVVPMFAFASSAEAAETVTVKFYADDDADYFYSETVTAGTEITLPAVPELDGYEALGWVTEEVPTTTTAPKYYEAGDDFVADEDAKLFALYSKTTTSSAGEAGWNKTDISNILPNDVVVITMSKSGKTWALSDENGSSKQAPAVEVTIVGNSISGSVSDAIQWNISNNDGTLTIYPNGDTSKWLCYTTSDAKGVRINNKTSNNTFVVDSNGYLKNVGTGKYIGVYNSQDWRGYSPVHANISGQTLSFYVYKTGSDESTTTYTTGNITEQYTISFVVDGGVKIDALTAYEDTAATLPTVDVPAEYAALGYEFEGWATAPIDGEVESISDLYKEKFTATNDITLYAVFSYVKEGDPSAYAGYTLVTDAAALAAGDKIILVAKDYNFALSTTQNSNNRGQTAVTKNGTSIDPGLDVQIITLEAGTKEGTFAFYTGSAGYLYAASDSRNYLRTQPSKDDNASWTIAISSNSATIVAQGANTNNVMQYNQSSSLFSCYGSASQKAISIYKLSGSNVVYGYVTTLPEIEVEPELPTYEEPTITGANLTIGADLSVNYYIGLPEDLEYDEIKMVFTFNNKTIDVTDFATDDATGRLIFTFTGIAPQCMTDNIAAELVIDGETVAEKAEYSVYTYAKNKLADEISDELRTLIFDMLNYGAKAQLYRGYKVDTLATDGIEGFVASEYEIVSGDKSATEPERDDVKFIAAGVNFDYVNRIYVKFTVAEGVDFKIEADCKLEVIQLDATTYIAYSDAIYATEFNRIVTFDLYAEGEFVQEVEYTVSAYVYSQLGYDDAMADLAIALYNYGASADAYAKSIK